MAVAAACAGGACCHQFRITLKWDHRPQTHLDSHAKQDHTRILRPEGFSSWCLSFTCITVDWFIKHRYPEPKWPLQVGAGRTMLRSHDISIVLSDTQFHGKDCIENTSASYPVFPACKFV